jgi:hypothetical protein
MDATVEGIDPLPPLSHPFGTFDVNSYTTM